MEQRRKYERVEGWGQQCSSTSSQRCCLGRQAQKFNLTEPGVLSECLLFSVRSCSFVLVPLITYLV